MNQQPIIFLIIIYFIINKIFLIYLEKSYENIYQEI